MTQKEIFILILNIFEFLACLAGVVYYRRLKSSHWQWFAIFLVFTFATEMFANYMSYRFKEGSGNFIYRYGNLPATFLFFLWLFYNWFAGSKYKWIAVAGMVVYSLAWIAEEIFLKHSNNIFDSLSYELAVMFLLILAIIYYRTLVKSQSNMHYKFDLMFWVVTGILAYYFVTMPIIAMRVQIYKANPFFFNVYWRCGEILNYLMYTFFIIGIKWGNPYTSYQAYSQVLPLSY